MHIGNVLLDGAIHGVYSVVVAQQIVSLLARVRNSLDTQINTRGRGAIGDARGLGPRSRKGVVGSNPTGLTMKMSMANLYQMR